MGLKATCQDGHITFIDGDIIVMRWFLSRWKESEQEARAGGDYTEVRVHRSVRKEEEDAASSSYEKVSQPSTETGCVDQLDGRDADAVEHEYHTQNKYVNKNYSGLRKFQYGVSWYGYWNKTLVQLDEEFKSVYMKWQKSKECTALMTQLRDLKSSVKLPVNNVVALGIGSLHNSPWKGIRTRSGDQLSAVITIRETLGESGKPLPCVVQDPAYSQVEKEYYGSLGLEAVDDPDAFPRINANTLVLHIGSYFFIPWWICEGTWPTAMVCGDWANAEPKFTKTHPSHHAPRVNAMFKAYEHVPFIDDGDRSVSEWGGVNLYWRKHETS